MKNLFLFLSALVMVIFTASPGAADSKILAFVRDGNIYVSGPDGSSPRQMTEDGDADSPAVSPDGALLAYHAGRDERTGFGRIRFIDLATGKNRVLLLPGVHAHQDPCFSWDGTMLTFVGMENVREDADGMVLADMFIGVFRLSDMRLLKPAIERDALLDAGYVYSHPSFSPDGRHVVYQESGSDVSGGFVIIDFDGNLNYSYPKASSQDYAAYWGPRFLPRGDQVLCWSPAQNPDEKNRICVIDLPTGGREYVTEGAKPTLLDGGTSIVFERWDNDGQSDLWRLDRGGKPIRIVRGASSPAAPHSGPAE